MWTTTTVFSLSLPLFFSSLSAAWFLLGQTEGKFREAWKRMRGVCTVLLGDRGGAGNLNLTVRDNYLKRWQVSRVRKGKDLGQGDTGPTQADRRVYVGSGRWAAGRVCRKEPDLRGPWTCTLSWRPREAITGEGHDELHTHAQITGAMVRGGFEGLTWGQELINPGMGVWTQAEA